MRKVKSQKSKVKSQKSKNHFRNINVIESFSNHALQRLSNFQLSTFDFQAFISEPQFQVHKKLSSGSWLEAVVIGSVVWFCETKIVFIKEIFSIYTDLAINIP